MIGRAGPEDDSKLHIPFFHIGDTGGPGMQMLLQLKYCQVRNINKNIYPEPDIADPGRRHLRRPLDATRQLEQVRRG